MVNFQCAPGDIEDVSQWLRVPVSELRFRSEILSIEVFREQISECLSTYDEFSDDARRMRDILAALKRGEGALPVFVEDGDESMFILEGRHRIVAFSEFGLTQVEVMFASGPRPEQTLTSTGAPSPRR